MQDNIAKQRAWVYAMESMLTYTTGMVDRGDEDIMLETAICKVFCSHFGFEGPDAAMQVMGGEGFMTENELERVGDVESTPSWKGPTKSCTRSSSPMGRSNSPSFWR